MGQDGLDGIEAAAQVHVKKPLPGLRRDVLKLLGLGNPRIVHQKIHRPQLPLDMANHFLHGFAVGHIGLVAHDPAALFLQAGGQSLRQIHPLNAVDAHFIAASGQGLGTGGTDAPGGTGNQGNIHDLYLILLSLIMQGRYSNFPQ